MTPPRDLDALERLAKAATPGEWRVLTDYVAGRERWEPVAYCGTSHIWSDGPLVCDDGRADAAFIAAANPETVLALLARLKEVERRNGELATALRRCREAGLDVFGNWEDCDDCGPIADSGEADGCRIHTPTTVADNLAGAIDAAEDLLGPCQCGHDRMGHGDCDERACKTCACRGFALPPLPAPPGDEATT